MEQLQAFFGGPLGGAVLVLAGVVVSEWLQGRRQEVAFLRQKSWEERQLRVQRLEEVGTLAGQIDVASTRAKAALDQYLTFGPDPGREREDWFRDVDKAFADLIEAGRVAIPRLATLAAVYARQLSAEIMPMERQLATLNALLIILRSSASVEEGWLRVAGPELEATQAKCADLREAAAALIRSDESDLPP